MEKVTFQDESKKLGSMCDRKHNNISEVNQLHTGIHPWVNNQKNIETCIWDTQFDVSIMKTIAHSWEWELHEDMKINVI